MTILSKLISNDICKGNDKEKLDWFKIINITIISV